MNIDSLWSNNFILDATSLLSIPDTFDPNCLYYVRLNHDCFPTARLCLITDVSRSLNTHVKHIYMCCLLACLLSLRHDHHDRDEHAGGVKYTTSSYSPNMIVNVQYVSVMDSQLCVWRSVRLHLSDACKSISCPLWPLSYLEIEIYASTHGMQAGNVTWIHRYWQYIARNI